MDMDQAVSSSTPVSGPDLESERAALLALDAEARRAHFATDPDTLVTHDAEPVLFVREGRILSLSHAELRAIFAADFEGATYHAWDNLQPPIVQIANDASLACVITRRHIRRTVRYRDGTMEDQEFIYAGINTYAKQDAQWTRLANVSTFAEEG